MRWSIGDRVERELFMDDGTWDRQGDSCLRRSPMRTGVVDEIEIDRPGYCGPNDVVHVLWDDGSSGIYFEHGLRSEVAR